MKKEILQTSLQKCLNPCIGKLSVKPIEPLAVSTKTFYNYFDNNKKRLEKFVHFFYSGQADLMILLSQVAGREKVYVTMV